MGKVHRELFLVPRQAAFSGHFLSSLLLPCLLPGTLAYLPRSHLSLHSGSAAHLCFGFTLMWHDWLPFDLSSLSSLCSVPFPHTPVFSCRVFSVLCIVHSPGRAWEVEDSWAEGPPVLAGVLDLCSPFLDSGNELQSPEFTLFSACILSLGRLFVILQTRACPPGSSVHGILQARILEWVAISSFRRSSGPWDQSQVSCVFLHWQVASLPLHHLGSPSLYLTREEKGSHSCRDALLLQVISLVGAWGSSPPSESATIFHSHFSRPFHGLIS